MLNSVTSSKSQTNGYTLLLSLIFVGGLYLLQTRIMSTIVRHMTDPAGASEETVPADGEAAQRALLHCNRFVRDRLGDSSALEFPNRGYRAWELSDGRYLIRSHVLKREDSGYRKEVAFTCRACHVQYTGNAGEKNNIQDQWTLEGLEFNEI